MGARPRNDYSFEYVKSLREKVLLAYEVFEKAIKLKPNKSRGSEGYVKLRKLLVDEVDKTISLASLVDFFTKDPSEDENNKPIITYEIFTVGAFEEFVKIADKISGAILGNPQNENNPDVTESIKRLLRELSTRNSFISSVEEKMFIEENGTCTIYNNVFIKTLSEVSNIKIQYGCKHPIKVKSVEAYDHITEERFAVFPFEVSDYIFIAHILFPNIIKKNTNFYYNYSICIENYFKGDLIEKKYAIEEINIVANKYESYKEELFFPDTDFFKTLKIRVESHPKSSLVSKEIYPIYKDGYKIYTIEHRDLLNIKTPIKLHLQLT